MANARVTKKDYFNMINDVIAQSGDPRADEMQAFIAHEIELLSRKSSNVTMTRTQKENIAVMDTIRDVLADSDEPRTISELQVDSRLAEYSNQKLSALLRKMIESGDVVKTMNKKKAYFALAE